MGTIYPSQIKNIGSRNEVKWTDEVLPNIGTPPGVLAIVGSNPYVSIDGYFGANYNISVGGTLQLRFGSPSNPLVPVVIPPGSYNALGIASLINAVQPNSAFVNYGRDIKLVDLNYVEVNDNGGIPISELGLIGTPTNPLVKDITNTNYSVKSVDSGFGLDRNDFVSHPIDIPGDANIVSVWHSSSTKSEINGTPAFCIAFTNGYEGDPIDKFIFGYSYSSGMFQNGSEIFSYMENQPAVYEQRFFYFGNVNHGHPAVTVQIPAGTTKMRIFLASGPHDTLPDPTPYDWTPPSVKMAAYFGVR